MSNVGSKLLSSAEASKSDRYPPDKESSTLVVSNSLGPMASAGEGVVGMERRRVDGTQDLPGCLNYRARRLTFHSQSIHTIS